MATGTTVVTIVHPEKSIDLDTSKKKETLAQLVSWLEGYAMGLRSGGTVDAQQNGGTAVAASGTLTLASSSGTVGGSINGVSVTVAWGTSDTATATALAAAINASVNALVAGHVTATSLNGVVTVTAANKGIVGNAITLAASGTNVTASGARLTGGTAASAQAL